MTNKSQLRQTKLPTQVIEGSYVILDELNEMQCYCFETLVATSQKPEKVTCHKCAEKERIKEKLGELCD